MSFCLLKKDADLFRDALIKNQIDPANLATLSSEQRRAFFEPIVGKENAADVNRLLESKLLLKNQQRAYTNWAKEVLGMKAVAKRDLLSRVEKMTDLLTPANQQAFLEDLAKHKLGVGVSLQEAAQINDLANNATKLKQTRDAVISRPDYSIFNETETEKSQRLEYGRAQYDLTTYVADLKKEANRTTWEDFKNNKVRTVLKGVMAIPGQAKGSKASFDNSAIFRQGWKTMFTNPKIWLKNSQKTFTDIWNTFGDNTAERELNADILSRQNFELMQKAKLDVGVREEDFPSAVAEKIPLVRRAYKASENAYSGFLKRTRADIFDKYIEIAKNTDVDLTDTELKGMGRLVNSLTGRGDLGSLEKAGKFVNNVFFSPKFLKSHIDTLVEPLMGGASVSEIVRDGETGSNFVRKQAAKNLVKIAVGNAVVLGLARTLMPNSVTFDPRSSDFGKIRIGDTRFDVSGGMGSLAVLAARVVTGQTTSTSTGKTNELNAVSKNGKPVLGASTKRDVMEDFFENKFSPVLSVVMELADQKTRGGFPLTKDSVPGFAGREVINLTAPLPFTNTYETWQNPNRANLLLTVLADGLGLAANTFSSEKDLKRQIKDAEKEGDSEKVKMLQDAKKQVQTEKKQNNPVEIKKNAESENYPELKTLRTQLAEARKNKDLASTKDLMQRIIEFKKANGIK